MSNLHQLRQKIALQAKSFKILWEHVKKYSEYQCARKYTLLAQILKFVIVKLTAMSLFKLFECSMFLF